MKQKISPGAAAAIVVAAAVVLCLLLYKVNFAGPPPPPPIGMKATGNGDKPIATFNQMGGSGLPGREQNQSGAPTPGGGMPSPSLPGGSGGMSPSLPGAPPR